MIKVIDIDAIFDKYISDYVYGNIGKIKPEEIENKIPELYVKFGDEKISELDGKTPNTYYKAFTAEQLVQCLERHLNEGVAVSDFLCEAITSAPNAAIALVNALDDKKSEELVLYAMNMLSEVGAEQAKDRLLEFVLWDYGEGVRELATEMLQGMADLVKEQILAQFNEVEDKKKVNLVEILSGCKKDDRVFKILIDEFIKNQHQIPLYAGYLAKYGEERALPFLKVAIENEKISYADFEELRFAIEALGGEYDKKRDFTKDKTFRKIKAKNSRENELPN